MALAARVGMAVGVEQAPAVCGGLGREGVEGGPVRDMERQVVEAEGRRRSWWSAERSGDCSTTT
ncbi:hypothetical protein SMICM17S_04882 [Streptomyces microflavus]